MRYVVITIGLILVWGCQFTEGKPSPAKPGHDFSLVMAKARELYKSGESRRAMEIVDGILQIDRENPHIHELKGEILLDTGKYKEAVLSFQRAEKLDSQAFTAYLKEGVTHEMLHEEEETTRCLKKGLRIFRNISSEQEFSDEVLRLTEDSTRRIMKYLPRVKIAVLYFEGDYEATAKNYNRFIPKILVKTLAKQKKRFEVEDPRGQSRFLEKRSMGMYGIVDPEKAQLIGKLLQVDWIIMGTVYQDIESFQIDLQMLHVRTGKIVYKDSIGFLSQKDVEIRCEDIVKKIVLHSI